jgi:NodT family efflux transporter outer membrane factor (OMF) lipoprotein
VKANSLEAQATLADLENVRLTVQAEVAVDYFQLRVLDAQKQLLDATVIAYQESLKLTQAQYGAGLASDQDVAQAETQLNTTLAQATDLGIQRAQLEHAIATLLGQPASSFSIATNSLTTKPVAIPFGVPSQLLERRPDIAAAERRVAEANAQIGVARAAYYPTITLSGAAGYQNTSVQNLFSGPGLVWSVGATWRKHFLTAACAKRSPNSPVRFIKAPLRITVRPCSPRFRKSKTICQRCESCRRNCNNRMPPSPRRSATSSLPTPATNPAWIFTSM